MLDLTVLMEYVAAAGVQRARENDGVVVKNIVFSCMEDSKLKRWQRDVLKKFDNFGLLISPVWSYGIE